MNINVQMNQILRDCNGILFMHIEIIFSRQFYKVISRIQRMEDFHNYERKLNQYLMSYPNESLIKFDTCEGYGLALLSCSKTFDGRFQSTLLSSKKKIIQLLRQKSQKLKDSEAQTLKSYLRYLLLQSSALLNDALINLYLWLVSLANTVKPLIINTQLQLNEDSNWFPEILKGIIKILTPLLLYYFVNKQYNKRANAINFYMKSCTKISSQKNIASQQKQLNLHEQISDKQELLNQIQTEFSILPLAKLVDLYLKEEQNKIIESVQICRLCSKQIKLKNFQIHIKRCSKKSMIEMQMKQMQQKSKRLSQQVQLFQKSLMVKQDQWGHRQNLMLKILSMLKDSFTNARNGKTALKRNTTINGGVIGKMQPIQLIKVQLEKFEDLYQKDELLSKLIANRVQILVAKKKLQMAEVCSKGQITSSKASDIGSFESLEQSINNVIGTSTGVKTKKSIFASKKSDANKLRKQSISQSASSCSSVSLKEPEFNGSDYSKNQSHSQISQSDSDHKQNQKQNQLLKHSLHLQDKFIHSQKNFKSMKIVYNQITNEEETIMSIDDFQILKLLGKGAFGKVYLVRRKKTNDLYALKHVLLDNSEESNQFTLIQNQHQIFKKIAGDHLIRAPFAFTEQFGHFFVLQFMPGGDLSTILNDEVYLEQKHAKFYLAEIVLALQHLHKCDIIHRDLKPENIVIDKSGHIKLTDFGLSQIKIKDKIDKFKDKLIDIRKRNVKQKNSRRAALINRTNSAKIIGTPDYIAPEIINQTSNNNHSIDWWSLGVMAYELLVGCRPFSAMTIEEVLSNIIEGKIEWPQIGKEQGMMSPQAYDLIFKLLDKNFQKRLGNHSSQQIKNHPFFQGINWKNIKFQKPPILPLKQLNLLKQYSKLTDDEKLRQEIKINSRKETMKTKKLAGLENFVRYDILLQETYQSVQQKIKNEKLKIQKMKSIGSYIENQEKENDKPNQNKKRESSLFHHRKPSNHTNRRCVFIEQPY